MRLPFFIMMVLMLSQSHAQKSSVFVSSPITDTIPTSILNRIKDQLKEKKREIIADKVFKANFVTNIYDKQSDALVKYFNEDYFITEGPLYNYLQSILAKILEQNPKLPHEIKIYPFRSAQPNALTFWDGTIGFTLGLLAKMENEDQVAFVMCHEMAHYYADHHLQDVKSFTKTNFDPNLEREINTIKSGQYGTYTKLKELMKKLGFSFSRHSRKQESEADSLGLSYLLNAKYSPLGSFRIMEILDSVDATSYNREIDMKKYFTFTDYPFKNSWSTYSKSSFIHKSNDDEFGNSDTLKTHPDCKKRLSRLRSIVNDYFPNTNQVEVREGKVVMSISKRCGFELVDSEYHFKKYGRSLYYAMNLLEEYPQSRYLNAMVGMNLFNIYQSQKNHFMSKAVQLPNSNSPDGYNKFLSFFHTLRISELSAISYRYVINRPEEFFEDEDYLYSFWLVSHLPNSETAPSLVKDSYIEKFPAGKYILKFNEKLK